MISTNVVSRKMVLKPPKYEENGLTDLPYSKATERPSATPLDPSDSNVKENKQPGVGTGTTRTVFHPVRNVQRLGDLIAVVQYIEGEDQGRRVSSELATTIHTHVCSLEGL